MNDAEWQWAQSGMDFIDEQTTAPGKRKFRTRLRYDSEGLVLPPDPPVHEPIPLTYDTAMTFEEWKEAGYWVRKGSKSELRDINGVPQFCIEQVEKR